MIMLMKNKTFKLIDKKGNRKYFTIIPNYIIDHSTAYEQSLYLVMKRIAGEKMTCYASPQTIAKKMGVAPNTVRKYRDKLEQKVWIKKIGMHNTGVTNQSTCEYKMVDIWKFNIDSYDKNKKPSLTESSHSMNESVHLVHEKGSPAGKKEETIQEKSLKKKTEEVALPNWIDKNAWGEWEQHCKEKYQKLTPMTIKKQIEFLEINKSDHVEIIQTSIRNGWKGVFELKKKKPAGYTCKFGHFHPTGETCGHGEMRKYEASNYARELSNKMRVKK